VSENEFLKPSQLPDNKRAPNLNWKVLALLFVALAMAGIWAGATFFGEKSPVPSITPTEMIDEFATTSVSEFTPIVTQDLTPTVPPVPTEIIDAKGVEMVLVTEGPFEMGSDLGSENEKPQHTVYLSNYYIDKYEVTNIFYKACVNAGYCSRPKNIGSYSFGNYYDNPNFEDYPVIYVDWNMADAYCQWRGDGARLPTEAEWEKAAKGDSSYSYPWGDTVGCEIVNYNPSGPACVGDTTRVGSYELGKSPYGAYDMAGNVWEWVGDMYQKFYYYTPVPDPDPTGPTIGDGRRIRRGGSWLFSESSMRVTNRSPENYYFNDWDVGFRCARPITP